MDNLYTKLLSFERFRTSSVSDRNIISEAESDRGRLLFCAAFRRLQQKAQVFSMEPNAAVRSRLTHSLEVSQMGRYIADQLSIKLINLEWATKDECSALVTFVETACLMHDIGNPPFGHFGEAAISEWFRTKGCDKIIQACSAGKSGALGHDDPRIVNALADFLEFDGNPQGLRVVTRLQRNSDEFGLNLTKTTLASYLKYVRSNLSIPNGDLNSPFLKKCGYFSTEANIVSDIWKEFNYSKPQRFPLAYIMEAADDIAYCISDLEDSIEKGLLEKSLAFNEIYDEWYSYYSLLEKKCDVTNSINEILVFAKSGCRANKDEFTYTDFRTSLNRVLVNYCVSQYIENHESILSGTLISIIPSNSSAGKILDILKSYCRSKVYCHESVQKVELAGYHAIYGLLEQFSCLIECCAERFSLSLDYSQNKDHNDVPIVIEKKILSLFPKNYIKVYKDELAKLVITDNPSFRT
ncbi:dGTPase [Shewanella sp. N2AIL]|uniref:dGTPase n=1 Tax=Shewanella sp. N2AIL TaxID=2926851 RepID=UPI001F59BC2A|nr:dGTPase [Shewanella sp. N2AIL]MCI2965145.1 dGTPase [Shewanella sp. N2AIL]